MRAKKSLGQNFLKSKQVVQKIVDTSGASVNKTILEIGPGRGALTSGLLMSGAHVIAIEKDADLLPLLQDIFAIQISSNQLELINGDVLDIFKQDVPYLNYDVVANIPYYITGAIIKGFLIAKNQPNSMTLLVQKEVAQRIVAHNGKESILSLSVKCYGSPKYVQKVQARFFSPVPKVDSAILHISDINKDFFDGFTEDEFFNAVKQGFAQKRKKLIKNLSHIFDKENLHTIFTEMNLDENVRAESLSIDKWSVLCKQLYNRSI